MTEAAAADRTDEHEDESERVRQFKVRARDKLRKLAKAGKLDLLAS
jgi:hypothetical protein